MSIRILLIEDDPVSRDVLAALLECRGYEVDQAEDGFTALRFVQDNSYDLVFIDYHLPEMDGYALARLMRTLGEKTHTNLNMVAITADRFGLAARRGVDSVFDGMLTKPIDPERFYAFVEDFLADRAGKATMDAPTKDVAAIDSFLAEPSPQDAQSAAQVLWRVRGIANLPHAGVFPAPSAAERQALEYCFRIVEPSAAECLVLMRPSGLAELEAFRAQNPNYLAPLFTLDEGNASLGDVAFKVGDGESWSAAAATLAQFRQRRAALKPTAVEATGPMRLAAYMYVADRSLVLRRNAAAQTSVPYTAGFSVDAILMAVKQLAAAGLVLAKAGEAQGSDLRELLLSLTAKGFASVAAAAAVRPAAG